MRLPAQVCLIPRGMPSAVLTVDFTGAAGWVTRVSPVP